MSGHFSRDNYVAMPSRTVPRTQKGSVPKLLRTLRMVARECRRDCHVSVEPSVSGPGWATGFGVSSHSGFIFPLSASWQALGLDPMPLLNEGGGVHP